MESKIVFVVAGSQLFNDIKKSESFLKHSSEGEMYYSINVPEFGLRWPIDDEYYQAMKEARLKERDNCFVFIVIDEKKWLLSKIKYGHI